ALFVRLRRGLAELVHHDLHRDAEVRDVAAEDGVAADALQQRDRNVLAQGRMRRARRAALAEPRAGTEHRDRLLVPRQGGEMPAVRGDGHQGEAVVVAADPDEAVDAAGHAAVEINRLVADGDHAQDAAAALLEVRGAAVEGPASADRADVRRLELLAGREDRLQ